MGNIPSEEYDCIGGQGWYLERCSSNFLVNVIKKLFSEISPLSVPFRLDSAVSLGDTQSIRLSESERSEYFENVTTFMLRAGAGIIRGKNASKYEWANFSELSLLVHVPSTFEELFIRRNSVILFMHRILRNAQIHNVSLKPAYPGTSSMCICGYVPHHEYCPLHDLLDTEKSFLFPPLEVGMHVICGPDWQWENQGAGTEGEVIAIKPWKGVPNIGVQIQWANGDSNVYRYGADNNYDVVDANPTLHEDYVPLGGLTEPSAAFWSRYVESFLWNGLKKTKKLFSSSISRHQLKQMLPDYDTEPCRNETLEGQAISVIQEVMKIAEFELIDYMNSFDPNKPGLFHPPKHYVRAVQRVLFPYQIYLFSQAEGDIGGQRAESAILKYYLEQLISSSLRIIGKSCDHLSKHADRVSEWMDSLQHSIIGQLLPFAVNSLLLGTYSLEIIGQIRGDIELLAIMWCTLLKACNVDSDLNQDRDQLISAPIYSPTYVTPIQPFYWYSNVFYTTTATASKLMHSSVLNFCLSHSVESKMSYQMLNSLVTTPIGFSGPQSNSVLLSSPIALATLNSQGISPSTYAVVDTVLESYIFSGGLREMDSLNDSDAKVMDMFNNVEDKFFVVHQWLDSHFPEKGRKLNATSGYQVLELKIFVSLCYLCGFTQALCDSYDQISTADNVRNVDVPEDFAAIWKEIMSFRVHLNKKKQTFSTLTAITSTRTFSMITNPRRTPTSDFSEGNRSGAHITSPPSTAAATSSGSSSINAKRLVTFSGPTEPLNASSRVVGVGKTKDNEMVSSSSSVTPLSSSTHHSALLSQRPNEMSRSGSSGPSAAVASSVASSASQMTPPAHDRSPMAALPDPTSLAALSPVSTNGGNSSITGLSPSNGGGTGRVKWSPTLSQVGEGKGEENNDGIVRDRESMPPESLDDYITLVLQKLSLLMELNVPIDLNATSQLYVYDCVPFSSDNSEEFQAYLKQLRSQLVRRALQAVKNESGEVPTSMNQLVRVTVMKFLQNTTSTVTISTRAIREVLKSRSSMALNRAKTIISAKCFLQQLSSFPQACRLYILGLSHALSEHKQNSKYSQSHQKSMNEECFATDFTEGLQGASRESMNELTNAMSSLCEYLMTLFKESLKALNWRLGCAIIWFLITTVSSYSLYFHHKLQIGEFLRQGMYDLCLWYRDTFEHNTDLLISPGLFWDSMSEKKMPLKGVHFQSMLNKLKNKGCFVDVSNTDVPGIFPISVLALYNSMRLAYTILLIQQVSDYGYLSKQSPARNAESLYCWTLSDVSNLLIRQSPQYLRCTQGMLHEFMQHLSFLQAVFSERCDQWKPFSSPASKLIDSTTCRYGCNDYSSSESKEEKASDVTGDMLISACEGLIASYLAYVIFLSKSVGTSVVPWKSYGDLFWNFLYSSPRHQKQAMIILQYTMPYTSFIPNVFDSDREHEPFPLLPKSASIAQNSIMKNPLLQFPHFNRSSHVKSADEDDGHRKTNDHSNIFVVTNSPLNTPRPLVTNDTPSNDLGLLTHSLMEGISSAPLATISESNIAAESGVSESQTAFENTVFDYNERLSLSTNQSSSERVSAPSFETQTIVLSDTPSGYITQSSIPPSSVSELKFPADMDEIEKSSHSSTLLSPISPIPMSSGRFAHRNASQGISSKNSESLSIEMKDAFIYYLLHMCAHADCCLGSSVGERMSCALCCRFFQVIYHSVSRYSSCSSLANKTELLEEIYACEQRILASECRMNIKPEGQCPAYCACVTSEEAVYLVRALMKSKTWSSVINQVFTDILEYTEKCVKKELEEKLKRKRERQNERKNSSSSSSSSTNNNNNNNSSSSIVTDDDPTSTTTSTALSTSISNDGINEDTTLTGVQLLESLGEGNPNAPLHYVVRKRTAWYALSCAVCKVLGSVQPRVYIGSRVRINEYLMEGQNDVNTLLSVAYHSQGSGSIIQVDRSMGQALVLLDKIDTPKWINIFTFDVVDRVAPPQDTTAQCLNYVGYLEQILLNLPVCDALYQLPSSSQPFFNTSQLELPPWQLQNICLHLHVIRSIHHLLILCPTVALNMSANTVHLLMRIAVRPIPCNINFNTLVFRQYFNWFCEYLIDTYPGSPRLLPINLQEEAAEVQYIKKYALGFGMCKDDSPTDSSVRANVITDARRMKKSVEISGITGYAVDLVYRVLRAFQDDENMTTTYLLERPREFIEKLNSCEAQIEWVQGEIRDESVLTDMETGIRKGLISSSSLSQKEITPSIMSLVLPPFTQMHRIQEDTISSASLIGCIASVSAEDVVYTPIHPTGVITGVHAGNVSLSILNCNSGVNEQTNYPIHDVSLHQHRLLFSTYNIISLRGATGRIACCLSMKYSRELVISLLAMWLKAKDDIIDHWKLNPNDIVRITQYNYVAYQNSLILNPSVANHVSLISCLFRMLNECIKRMVVHDKYGPLLVQAFMDGTWDVTDKNKVYLNEPTSNERDKFTSDLREYSSTRQKESLKTKKQFQASSIAMTDQQSNSVFISSLHPSFPKSRYHDKVTILGAAGLRIIFDKRCHLDSENASLTFYADEEQTEIIARFTGSSESFCPFTVRGNTLRWMYESDMQQSDQWGYAFVIQPFENVNWMSDIAVLSGMCFDWNCYAMKLLIDIGKVFSYGIDDFFNRSQLNLLTYLQTSGLPFKSRVVELLTRLTRSPFIQTTVKLDIDGMHDVVMKFVDTLDTNSIIPSQLPLLLEFLVSYRLTSTYLHNLQIEDTADGQVPEFDANVSELAQSTDESLVTLHVLARCVRYRSLVPQRYIKRVLQLCGLDWTRENYEMSIREFRSFKRVADDQLIQAFSQRCQASNISQFEYSLNDFVLNDDDHATFYVLSGFSLTALRLRLAYFRLFNEVLLRVIHLIELMSPSKSKEDVEYMSLGVVISQITAFIFPSVKENLLELSIKQTEYQGKDAYPIIELDNRRVYSDMERSLSARERFGDEEMSALTSQCTFAQMYRQMKKHNVGVLRCKLDKRGRLIGVKFKGEQGLDWGGLYRDAVERCLTDLFSDRLDLFVHSPNAFDEDNGQNADKFVPNPKYWDSAEAMSMYSFVGNLIGISLRTKHVMSIELSSCVWKIIVGDELNEDDIEAVDVKFMNVINALRKCDPEMTEEEFSMTFELSFSVLDSTGNEVELLPSGSQIPVTFENRLKFCEMAVACRLNEWKQASEAIASGVFALVPQRSLSLFTWEQLERAVNGIPEISIDLLRKQTVYLGWTETHEVVQRFWRVMENLSNKDRSQFLRFVWSRSRLPKTDKWPRQFRLTHKQAGNDMLPVAHTCFFQLDLPQYTEDSIMREKLLVAIHYGSGEFLLR